MAFSRAEFDEAREKREKKQIRDNRKELQSSQRAALSATQITGDEHWDFFLAVVKERIETLSVQLDLAIKQLKESDDFTTANLINQKLAVRLYGKEIEALNWVIELPAKLMEQGADAKQLLGSIEEPTD